MSNELLFFKEIKHGFHKKRNIQLSLDLYSDHKIKSETIVKYNNRIISHLLNEIAIITELKDTYFEKQKYLPKIQWNGSSMVFLILFTILYKKKWVVINSSKMSRIAYFKVIMQVFNYHITNVDSSISKVKLRVKRSPTQTYPFSKEIIEKYFL